MAIVAMTALAGVTGAQATKTTVVRSGDLSLTVSGGSDPQRLPETRNVPISLKLGAEVTTADGNSPPAAQTLEFRFDRQGAIETDAMPICRRRQLTGSVIKSEDYCSEAVVGGGGFFLHVALPGQIPFLTGGRLVAFNGGVEHGKPVIFVMAALSARVEWGTFVTKVVISDTDRGTRDTRAIARIPPIADGMGVLKSFNLKFGRKPDFLSARCENGRLSAHWAVSFQDGNRLQGDHAQPCHSR